MLDGHWDLGSVRHFHGEAREARVRRAYRAAGGPVEIEPGAVASFSSAIALHHASRSGLPGERHRLARAVRRVREIVSGRDPAAADRSVARASRVP